MHPDYSFYNLFSFIMTRQCALLRLHNEKQLYLPVTPGGPGGPGNPGGPGKPSLPGGPGIGNPGEPFSPFSPLWPGTPGDPTMSGTGRPLSKVKYR